MVVFAYEYKEYESFVVYLHPVLDGGYFYFGIVWEVHWQVVTDVVVTVTDPDVAVDVTVPSAALISSDPHTSAVDVAVLS